MGVVTVRVTRQQSKNAVTLRFIRRQFPSLITREEPFMRTGNHYLNDTFTNSSINYGHMLSQRLRSIHDVITVTVSADDCIVCLRPKANYELILERIKENVTFTLSRTTPWVITRPNNVDWRYRFSTKLLADGKPSMRGEEAIANPGYLTPCGRRLCRLVQWRAFGVTLSSVRPFELHFTPSRTGLVNWPILDAKVTQQVANAVGARDVQVQWA
jgi:hypothetical protein